MLVDEIRTQRRQAMLDRDGLRKTILGVILGEVETIASRENKMTDDRVVSVIRKVIASNEETTKAGATNADQLQKENEILSALLPKIWTVAEIEAFFLNHNDPVVEQIVGCGNEGRAMGIAMKALKAVAAPVLGDNVGEVVKKLLKHWR